MEDFRAKHLTITAQEAAAELIRRERAYESLLDYTKYIEIPGKPVSEDEEEWIFAPVETGLALHHQVMLGIMEKVILREIPRAMFFMPPGSAKSTYGSVVTPSWGMGRFPGLKIILTSYATPLAKKLGRRARQIVRSAEYQAVFDTTISNETSAAHEWALLNSSEYMAGGILSGITGNRAHGIIVDDPVKGRRDADSEATQKSTWDAYQEDLRTRLIPGGWEMIIQTRWSDNDISGKLLPKDYDGRSGMVRCRDGRDWYILCLPAQCNRLDDPLGREIGEYMWPEWFTPEHFEGFKKQARTWSALFQQSPSPEEGTFFKKEWFEPRHNVYDTPKNVHKYGASDFAVTDVEDNDDADFTEHGVFAVDSQRDVWVSDWWYGQTTAKVWFESMFDLIDTHEPFCWFGEGGVIRRAIEPFLKTRQRDRESWCRIEWLNPIADKPTRARSLQAMAEAGKIHIPEGEWGDRLIEQLLKFPSGAFDDAVDVLAWFCLALQQAHPAIMDSPKDERNESTKRLDKLMKTQVDPHELDYESESAGSLWEEAFNGRDSVSTMDD